MCDDQHRYHVAYLYQPVGDSYQEQSELRVFCKYKGSCEIHPGDGTNILRENEIFSIGVSEHSLSSLPIFRIFTSMLAEHCTRLNVRKQP